MSEWKAKRFWAEVTVEASEGGYRVMLDSRGLATPGKFPLILPTRSLAEAVAAEWAEQKDVIQPLTMPFTRSANSAIERVSPQHAEVAQLLAAYGETDLLCYRAEGPEELVRRQAEAWDPLLDWAADRYGARLLIATGVLPVEQKADALLGLKQAVTSTRPFPLTALHDMITLTGSLVLGLAIFERHLTAADAWDMSRIDEDWQIQQWGEDEEAAEFAKAKADQLNHAERFLALTFAN